MSGVPRSPRRTRWTTNRTTTIGLAIDLATLMQRRRALKLLAGAGLGLGLVALGACGSDDDSGSSGTTSTTSGSSSSTRRHSSTTSGSTSDVDEIPEETAGPYPGDGSNGPNVLTESGIVRSDITSSFGVVERDRRGRARSRSSMTIVDVANGGAPLAGAAVYVWHCDREGGYSMYSEGVTDQNYLRGVQETGSDGTVTFTVDLPRLRTRAGGRTSTSRCTRASTRRPPPATHPRRRRSPCPRTSATQVYATDGYEQSVAT